MLREDPPKVAKTDLNRRSQRGIAATTYGDCIGVSVYRRGKASFAREESSRKYAKFNVSTAKTDSWNRSPRREDF